MFVFYLFIGQGFGQSKKSSYLVLYSGKIITADSLIYKSPYFYYDTSVINEDEVKYYMTDFGRFENTRLSNKNNVTAFKLMESPANKIDSTKFKDIFIVLYSGKVIKCKSIYYQSHYLITDSAKYLDDDVKFYQAGYKRFANMKFFTLFDMSSAFLEAEKMGKINSYEIKVTTRTDGRFQDGLSSQSYQTTSIKYYYNKGFGDLKYRKIKYLLNDMADNPECITRLKKLRFKLFGKDDAINEIVKLYNSM